MQFVFIPAGAFTTGSPESELGREKDETQHFVRFPKGFWLQTTEVTQKQWETVMGTLPAQFDMCGDNCPVENISLDEISTFIDNINAGRMGSVANPTGLRILQPREEPPSRKMPDRYRLPTEMEWEYAARSGSTAAFANGEITTTGCSIDPNLDAMGWYCYNAGGQPHPAGQKDPTSWGLYDMHGNVREWCQKTNQDGVAGNHNISRGGSWKLGADHCRAAARNHKRYNPSSSRDNDLGFRLVVIPGREP